MRAHAELMSGYAGAARRRVALGEEWQIHVAGLKDAG